MTRSPDDQIDPYESRLTRRIGDFAEQAVRPVDPMAVAAAAHAGARRPTLAARLFGSGGSTARLGVVLAGALGGAAALAVYLGAGGSTGPIASGPDATPTAMPGPAAACTADQLSGTIEAWDGAAGHRIATLKVHNNASVDCVLPELLRPALVDADGRTLIVGAPVSGTAPFGLPADADATAMVDMANYCGKTSTAALKLRLYLPDESSIELAASATLTNSMDVPPCNGPNEPATIQMQPLRLGTVSY
jgi:hypothetical protein